MDTQECVEVRYTNGRRYTYPLPLFGRDFEGVALRTYLHNLCSYADVQAVSIVRGRPEVACPV